MHQITCFGEGLPPLNTGLKCNILDCLCGGVDFPDEERLTKHQHNRVTAKFNSDNQKQCLSPEYGCGLWFKYIDVHLVHSRRSGKEREKPRGPDLLRSTKYETSSKDQENRTKSNQDISGIQKEDMGLVSQNFEDKNIRSGRVAYYEDDEDDEEDEEYMGDENDEDVENLNPSQYPKRKRTTAEATEDSIRVEILDLVSLQHTHAAKRKKFVVDLTGDSDDECATELVKKIRVAPPTVCHLKKQSFLVS